MTMFKTKEQIEKMSHDLDWAGNELLLQEGKIKDLTKELQEKDGEITKLKKALQLIYDNSRANYIDKESREEFRQIVDKYKLHKY